VKQAECGVVEYRKVRSAFQGCPGLSREQQQPLLYEPESNSLGLSSLSGRVCPLAQTEDFCDCVLRVEEARRRGEGRVGWSVRARRYAFSGSSALCSGRGWLGEGFCRLNSASALLARCLPACSLWWVRAASVDRCLPPQGIE
jgi:hypothetical protein